jgi:hypothetical protein
VTTGQKIWLIVSLTLFVCGVWASKLIELAWYVYTGQYGEFAFEIGIIAATIGLWFLIRFLSRKIPDWLDERAAADIRARGIKRKDKA